MTLKARTKALLFLSMAAILSCPALAQMVEVDDNSGTTVSRPKTRTETGKKKAGSYFQTRKAAKATGQDRQPADDGGGGSAGAPRYLALHIGTFFSDQGYKWGLGKQDDIGELNAGLTYRLGEWVNSMDFAMRVEYTSYSLDEGPARKLSVLPIITFPDANSHFPLYFGAGVGAGFFLKNIRKESALALDYQIFGGARFLNVIQSLGFMAEVGLKNHLHVFSDGQFNGFFVNVGTVFTF